MERYDPKRLELSTRDVVARAIYTEVKERRGTPHGGVFLDVSHLGDATVRRKLPSMYDQFMELAGVDITREQMEVGPTCHYFMGGIRVAAETGQSSVEGLFAAGECSGGMNGANRLGGNSLSDLLVFGKRAGESAARYGNAAGPPRIDEAQAEDAVAEMARHLPGPGGEDPYRIHEELKTVMQEDVGIFRDAAGLETAIGRIAELQRRAAIARAPAGSAAFNPGWNLCRDLRNMLIVSEAVARAALMRHESRGAHSRLDFPDYDRFWSEHNIVVRPKADGMAVEPRPVVTASALALLVNARKEAERA
jgi:succinate dehydrogenase / fumarate reductase flavoprotein subunit